MSYRCDQCKGHRNGKPIRVTTHVRSNMNRSGTQIAKEANLCSICHREFMDKKIKGEFPIMLGITNEV